jgi:hypothetical protein
VTARSAKSCCAAKTSCCDSGDQVAAATDRLLASAGIEVADLAPVDALSPANQVAAANRQAGCACEDCESCCTEGCANCTSGCCVVTR